MLTLLYLYDGDSRDAAVIAVSEDLDAIKAAAQSDLAQVGEQFDERGLVLAWEDYPDNPILASYGSVSGGRFSPEVTYKIQRNVKVV